MAEPPGATDLTLRAIVWADRLLQFLWLRRTEGDDPAAYPVIGRIDAALRARGAPAAAAWDAEVTVAVSADERALLAAWAGEG